MKLVCQILDVKGRDIWSVTPDSSVYDALELMARKNIGAVLVMEGDKLVGIMSERDYARKVILQGKFSKDTSVGDIMSTRILYVRSDQSIEDCMALMVDKRIRHLPVMKDEKLDGVISVGDVVNAIIKESISLSNWSTILPAIIPGIANRSCRRIQYE